VTVFISLICCWNRAQFIKGIRQKPKEKDRDFKEEMKFKKKKQEKFNNTPP
jgi:hypothetical protein